jgi:membrane protein required for colicin V production
MTWVDLVVLAVLAVSALLAFMRGFVRELLGIGAWAGAIFAGVWLLPLVRPRFQAWLGQSPWVDPVGFAVIFLASLIVLLLVAKWIGALVRASPISGVDRTLGLVFGLIRGAALLIVAYIGAGMVVEVHRWPEAVLNAESIGPVYRGAKWVVDRLPVDYRPGRIPSPPGRETTASALLQAAPQGRALGR